MTKDIVLGLTCCTSLGIGKILFPSKYLIYFSLIFLKSVLQAFCEIFSIQEAGNDGTFCAGGIVLLAGERVGHLFSGFEEGLKPSKISVSNGDSEGVATGTGDSAGSAIVAYQATRREKANVFCVKGWLMYCFFNKVPKVPKQVTSFDPLSKQITIVWGRGSQQ